MKKIAKIVLILILVVVVLEIVVLYVGPFSKHVEKNSILTMRIEGGIDERAHQDPFSSIFAGSTASISDIIEALDRASTDPRIAGVELEVGESTPRSSNSAASWRSFTARESSAPPTWSSARIVRTTSPPPARRWCCCPRRFSTSTA